MLHLERASCGLWLIERGMLHLKRACFSIWFIEREILYLKRASCGLWLIERGILLWERACFAYINQAHGPLRFVRIVRTVRADNTLCHDVIMKCALCMYSEYGPLATLTVCTERTIRQLLLA